MTLSSAAPPKKENYPKFLLKGESKLLGGNMTIAIVDEHEGNVQLAITIFDPTGVKHFDSFGVMTSEENIKLKVREGILISLLEQVYLSTQVDIKNSLFYFPEGDEMQFYVH